MKGIFSIDVDTSRSLVRMTMAGFFESADITRLVLERNTAHHSLQCPPNDHLTLIDMRDMEIQPQDSVDQFRLVLMDPATRSRRIAFVVARSLARMQIKRAAASREAGYFTTIDDAEAWLFDDGTPSD